MEIVDKLFIPKNRIGFRTDLPDSESYKLFEELRRYALNPVRYRQLSIIGKIKVIFHLKRKDETDPLMRMAIFIADNKERIDNLPAEEKRKFWVHVKYYNKVLTEFMPQIKLREGYIEKGYFDS